MRLADAFVTLPLAHRGLHGAAGPENSRAAFQAAIDGGFGIELDLQISSDGVAMVFHDDSLDRLTAEVGPVKVRTADQLQKIALLGGNEGIPTLAEVLALVAGQVPLLIEAKDQHGALGEVDGRLEKAAASDLRGYQGEVALMSFNPHSVAAFAEYCPDIARGITTCGYKQSDWPTVPASRCKALADIEDYDRVGACFISHHWADLDNPAVSSLKEQGTTVLTWTIRSEQQAQDAQSVADNITFEGYIPLDPRRRQVTS